MKKHFHPLTMQNLERVWKAEQKAKEEAEKLEQLQRELEEERRREALQQHAVEQGIVKLVLLYSMILLVFLKTVLNIDIAGNIRHTSTLTYHKSITP